MTDKPTGQIELDKHKRNLKRIIPYSSAYERLANQEARMWCQLRPCKDCGGPVNDGYCCNRCKSFNP